MIQRQRECSREKGIERVLLQTHKITIASPLKHPGSAVMAREIGWPSFHFSRSDIKYKQKGPCRWNKALMSYRLFSLEGTRAAQANCWRYEIPVRMCLEWLVVRPLASITLTAVTSGDAWYSHSSELGADTRVFGVKHTVKLSHPVPAQKTNTRVFLCHCAVRSNSKWNCWTDKSLKLRASPYFVSLCFLKTLCDWLVTREANVQRKQPQQEHWQFSQTPGEDNAAVS